MFTLCNSALLSEMMKWEIPSPPSYLSNSNWLHEDSKCTKWTKEENKIFETALALNDRDTPDLWHKVAALIPGKTVNDVKKQYQKLEEDISYIDAGLIQTPGYTTSSFTLEWVNHPELDGLKQSYCPGKRSPSARPSDQERKKGVPWTEEEHRQFLMGLKKYGKGDWRNIARNYVVSRTPTQVASHAQKYFIRQLSGGKDKRRSSIHDITTVNLADTRTPSPDNNRPPSPDQSTLLPQHPNSAGMPKALFDWNHSNDRSAMVYTPTHGNLFMPAPYGITSYGLKMQGQNLHIGTLHGSHIGPHSTVFQMQSSQCHPH
ncbi:hypothetical protein HHK36_016245 [Tetracentron sinense]|uniref:Uncharacterized protein n=1 Tax=Tetracentron sinense TaxID=13715 RepID=A0A834YZZ2_TETSI|nr:hypothetical protein HHK36_016245 [Tetracentron sinense]